MNTCAYAPYAGKEYWWEKHVFEKKDRVVVKSYDKNEKFVESFIMPTNRLPLKGNYETFSCANTVIAENEAIGEVLDSLEYEKGNSYANADMVTDALKEKGLKAATYAGWYFMPGEKGLALINTAWTVIESEEGKSLLDISNTYRFMIDNYQEMKKAAEEATEEEKKTGKKKEAEKEIPKALSERMEPMGIPYKDGFYVGSPCSGVEGYILYQALRQEYADLIKEGEKYMLEITKDLMRRG